MLNTSNDSAWTTFIAGSSIRGSMSFTIERCSVIHFGNNNIIFRYKCFSQGNMFQNMTLPSLVSISCSSPDLKPELSYVIKLPTEVNKNYIMQLSRPEARASYVIKLPTEVNKNYVRQRNISINQHAIYVRCHLEYA